MQTMTVPNKYAFFPIPQEELQRVLCRMRAARVGEARQVEKGGRSGASSFGEVECSLGN